MVAVLNITTIERYIYSTPCLENYFCRFDDRELNDLRMALWGQLLVLCPCHFFADCIFCMRLPHSPN